MPGRTPPSMGKLIAGITAQTVLFGVLLFAPAGTIQWWRGWVFIGFMGTGALAMSIDLLRRSPELVAERLKPPVQQGQPVVDRIITILMVLAFSGQLAFIPVDVFHLHLLPAPAEAITWLGLAMMVFGWWLGYRVLRENAFATAVVRYQEERSQRLIDTGPYAVVRHPMYSGGALFLIGMPLWLESYAGAVAALIPVGLMVARMFEEEALLRCDLPGYEEYTRRVRQRLIPGVW